MLTLADKLTCGEISVEEKPKQTSDVCLRF